MSKHDFFEYKFAKKIINDFPILIKMIDNFRKQLKPYNRYVAVQPVLQSLEESRLYLSDNLDYYKKVVETKGLKDDQ